MLKTIIVDDELLALTYLENLLSRNDNINIIGLFRDSKEGLTAIERYNPDLIFLDIHMPEISGIEIARHVAGRIDGKIIFTTGHEKYALKAFEIGVFDYILKPIEQERINSLINRIVEDCTRVQKHMICTFKYFHINEENSEVKNIKWRTSKAKELFIYLVQHESEIVRKDVLIELLWPELEVENAYENLYTTIYHVRKTLEDIEVDVEIISSVHGYELNLKNIRHDVSDWLQGVQKINQQLLNDSDNLLPYYKKVMKLYKGDYLAEETYVWKENEQERLRVIFIDTAKKMIDYLVEKEENTEAILLSLQLQDLYPYLDYSYFMLMKLYAQSGDMYNVERQYNRLKQVLKEEFNAKPNKSIKYWYQNWIEKQFLAN